MWEFKECRFALSSTSKSFFWECSRGLFHVQYYETILSNATNAAKTTFNLVAFTRFQTILVNPWPFTNFVKQKKGWRRRGRELPMLFTCCCCHTKKKYFHAIYCHYLKCNIQQVVSWNRTILFYGHTLFLEFFHHFHSASAHSATLWVIHFSSVTCPQWLVCKPDYSYSIPPFRSSGTWRSTLACHRGLLCLSLLP